MEQKSNTFEHAQEIAQKIKEEFLILSEEAKEILESNPELKKAVIKDGGLAMMLNEGMQFHVFPSGAVNSKDRIMAYGDFPLDGYLRSNKDRIQIQNLENLLTGFKQRKIEILEALKTPVTEEDASALSASIHKDLVLKPIEADPIFS